jgi:hypothetical protein
MSRERLDLDAVDAALSRLGINLDDDEGDDSEYAAGDAGALRRREPDGNTAFSGIDDEDERWWGSGSSPSAGDAAGDPGTTARIASTADLSGRRPVLERRSGLITGYRQAARPRPATVVRRHGTRPHDLPPLQIPAGYRRDRRGTWRRGDGTPVPGARDVTLSSRWPYRKRDPLLVPDDETRMHPELAWCRMVGEPAEMTARHARREVHLAAWHVPAEEWDDRDGWPLGVLAPELAPEALLDVAAVAAFIGNLAPSSVTAYLARGQMPEPQARVAGRPLWSAPVIVSWSRQRG